MTSIGIDRQEPRKPALPVIDFAKWTSSKPDRSTIAKELVEACHQTGFVYLINHGVSPELLEEAFSWAKKFYALPTEKKMQAGHPDGSTAFRGYCWPGLEKGATVYPGSELVHGDESKTEEQPMDFTESYGMGSDENHEEPNVWLPEEILPGWREFMTKFYWECWKASQNILRAFSLGLGLADEECFLQFHDGHDNELSVRHYPPVEESVITTRQMQRLHAHTDFDSFTLLFQDDCGGLEVLKPGCAGEFIEAKPIKNALVMNIGDMLMRWSNDYLISTIHRVHLPPLQDRYTGQERMTRERFSIPYFVSGKRKTMIECLPLCQSETNPPKYEPVLWEDYYRERINQVFPTEGT